MLNDSSEFIRQVITGQKRINNANGTKTYQIVKHIGEFANVFKGTTEADTAAYTLACEVPLRAQIYRISLHLLPRSGKSLGDKASYPIANANVANDKELTVQLGVIPIDFIGSSAGFDLSEIIRRKLNEYCVVAADATGFNLYGNQLRAGYLYPIMQYSKTLRSATGDQTFPTEISSNVITQSSYAPLVSCRQASYNVFAADNGNVLNALNDDGRHRKRFRLAAPFVGNTKQAENRYKAFNRGTGIIVIRSSFYRQDTGASGSDAHFEALFADPAYANTDVIIQVTYGEPYEDDITAMSTDYFIR